MEDYEDQIEGRNSVLEFLRSGKDVNRIFIQKGEKHGSINEIYSIAKKRRIIIDEVDKSVIASKAKTSSPQGVIAIVPPFDYSTIDDILLYAKSCNQDPFVVILDDIEDPRNFGAIIRTCESAGVHGIIIPKRNSVSVNSTVNKASAGAVNHMRIARVTNLNETIRKLKDEGLWICGTDGEADNFYYKQDLNGSLGIVIGSEGYGMKELVKKNCDFLVKIPMNGKVNSLNASVAAGIVIYEAVRQRSK